MEIAGAADTTVVVVTPGWGDAIQASKAGLLEVADIFVVNKADRDGAAETRRDLENMLDLNPTMGDWRPPVLLTTASSGEGVDDLWTAIVGAPRLPGGQRRAGAPPPPAPGRRDEPAAGAPARTGRARAWPVAATSKSVTARTAGPPARPLSTPAARLANGGSAERSRPGERRPAFGRSPGPDGRRADGRPGERGRRTSGARPTGPTGEPGRGPEPGHQLGPGHAAQLTGTRSRWAGTTRTAYPCRPAWSALNRPR